MPKVAAFFFTFAMFACGASNSAAQSRPPAPTDDTQLWNDVQLGIPLVKDKKDRDLVALTLMGTFRLGRDITHPVDERATVSVDFNLRNADGSWNFKITPGYLYQATQPFEGRKGYEHRLIFSVTPEYTWGVGKKYRLRDRNQFERRLRNSQADSTRYRNRLEIERKFVLRGEEFKFYVADEVYYDWSVDEWVRNRFSVGGRREFNKRYSLELYYLRQNDGRSQPGDLHVIGTILRINLPGRKSAKPPEPTIQP